MTDRAREVDGALSGLAQSLFALESAADVAFVRAQAEVGGPAGHAAAPVVAALAQLWAEYPEVREAGERLEAAVADGRGDEVDRLLGPRGLSRPDGTTVSLAALIADLQRRTDVVAEEVAQRAEETRQALARLDHAATSVADLVARAALLGAQGDPEIEAAQSTLDEAIAATATNATASDPLAAVERAIEVATKRVEDLRKQEEGLADALTAARARLDEITRLVAVGSEALTAARWKIAQPQGLLEPLDASGVDGDDGDERALRPWLARIQGEADTGGWRVASEGLARWQKVAAAWLANAQAVAAANRAPVARRNELRGLFQSYRAKAAALGQAEDATLAQRQRSTHDALYTAPCDLSRADRLVREYVSAVNTATRPGPR